MITQLKLQGGVSILLAIAERVSHRKLEAYATEGGVSILLAIAVRVSHRKLEAYATSRKLETYATGVIKKRPANILFAGR